ncbi:MAG: hypothetical protein QN131_13845 [Armatimonadota bacterium]|nr:hypothetical protein [Armatimonadota bacterium]MDR7550997.1 hypothetical protein [Armatimonadota bacterium]
MWVISAVVGILAAATTTLGHGDLQWTTLTSYGIERIATASATFEYASFLPQRLRTARLVQRAGDHLRFDLDGDGICEGAADSVGPDAGRWYAVLRRASREENLPEIGPAQVDTLYMDWRGLGRPSLVLVGHTPLARVKTVYFLVSVDLDDNGIYDLEVDFRAPRTLFWVVSYQYRDAAVRADLAPLVHRWRSRLVHDMVLGFYEAEYFFHHGPEFATLPVIQPCQ